MASLSATAARVIAHHVQAEGRARAAWPIRRVTLRDEAQTDERIPEDPDARVAMVAILTRAEWPLSGAELPRYTRAEMPGRIIRPAR